MFEDYKYCVEKINIPDWDQYFLSIAKLVSLRSVDSQTKHGSVLVNEDNHIIGTGYNGFPRKISKEIQSKLPNKRPEKYRWMLHSERNCLANCVLRPKNCIMYVTGFPCNDCLMAMWQESIQEVVCATGYTNSLNTPNYNADEKTRKEFLYCTGMRIREVELDYSYIKDLFNV